MLLLAALSWTAAHAEPASDPTLLLTERHLRTHTATAFRGGADRSPLSQAWSLQRVEAPLSPGLSALLAPELSAVRAPAPLGWAFRPGGGLALGTQAPEYRLGDTEPGLISARLSADVRLYSGIWEVAVRPEGLADVGGAVSGVGQAGVAVRELWVGGRTDRWSLGAGLRERFVGPGRHSSLMLTDNARPAPMMSAAGELGPLGRVGHLRAEVGAGWLDMPRTDVAHPGWLLMDLRWMPHPNLELGASRVGIFGGEGRPTPPLGQLLLPTDPHVYDDPDQLEPDQDELAAVDVRLTLPVGRWLPETAAAGRTDLAVELWWQYGGEDVIARRALGIPYPSLAGIGNLYGAEVTWREWLVTVEGVRVLDDYFRWYTGHRVYHDGLTQGGRSMAYAPGGDAVGLWGALTWLDDTRGVQVFGEQVRRVGVVEALGDNLLALSTDEQHWRAGAVGWQRHAQRGWWRLEASYEQVQGVNFVPGITEHRWRLALSR